MDWSVMKLCLAQLTDVNPADVLHGGLYRKCNTYKGGGGYDKFPEIYQRRFGKTDGLHNQFVVQLKGCPLRCPYCYVTPAGVSEGECVSVPTEFLVHDFNESGCKVFHLMGGAPALYIDYWAEIIRRLDIDSVFHSDLMLVEGYYKQEVIQALADLPRTLHAVSIKGLGPKEFKSNTGVELDERMFWSNLDMIVAWHLPFYFTFTGMSEESVAGFKIKVLERYGIGSLLDDSFSIDIIHYNALDYRA